MCSGQSPHATLNCLTLQDFLEGAEFCAVGGGGLLGLSVPGAAALPFAPAAAVRAALLQLCTRTIVMANGRITHDGPTQAVLDELQRQGTAKVQTANQLAAEEAAAAAKNSESGVNP